MWPKKIEWCCGQRASKAARQRSAKRPIVGHRQADVEVDRRLHVHRQFGRGLADLPERQRLGLRLRDGRVDGAAGLHRFAERFLECLAQRRLVVARDVDQRRERMLRLEGLAQLLPAERGLDEVAPHQLEGRERARKARLQAAEQVQRRPEVRQRDQRGRARPRRSVQPQHRAGDHAQRALGADEELLEVVAGVVLQHGAQHRQHAAVGQHHLEAQRLLAHHAELQHAVAAGVGRQVAADLAGAARTQVDAELQPPRGSGLLHRRQRGAGLHGDRRGGDIQRLDGVHPVERQRDGVGARHGRARQAGEAALGHDRHALRAAQAQHGRDFLGAARTHERERPHRRCAAPVGVVAHRDRVADEHLVGPERAGQRVEDVHAAQPRRASTKSSTASSMRRRCGCTRSARSGR